MCLVGLCPPSSLTKRKVHARKFYAVRLKTRYLNCLCVCTKDVLSEPATVITAAHFHHFCFSLTFKNTLTLSNTEPAPSNSSTHYITQYLGYTLPADFWQLPSTFLVTKNTLRSVVQDDTFDTNDTKLHSSAFITTHVRTQQIKTLP